MIQITFLYTDKSTEWWLKKYNIKTRRGSGFNDTGEQSFTFIMKSLGVRNFNKKVKEVVNGK